MTFLVVQESRYLNLKSAWCIGQLKEYVEEQIVGRIESELTTV